VDRLLVDCFSLLFPDDCRICRRPLREVSRVPVCRVCRQGVRAWEADYFCVSCSRPFSNPAPLDENGKCPLCRLGTQGFDAAYCYGLYSGVLRELIHLFKYHRVTPLAKLFGSYLTLALPAGATFDLIVPMPMHWWRKWRRGFNQAELLAREVSKRYGIPVVRAVRRTQLRAPQAGLSNHERRRNVRGVFAVSDPKAVAGRRILLVDDVITTGSTAAACARVLKQAGASRVTLLTLARADRRWLSGGAPAAERDPDVFYGGVDHGVPGSYAPTGACAQRELRAD